MPYQRSFAELARPRYPLSCPSRDPRAAADGYFGRDAQGRREWKRRVDVQGARAAGGRRAAPPAVAVRSARRGR